MAFLQVKNRAVSTLASGISDTDTSLTVASGDGAKFPQPGNGFHITIDDEILKCTARSGDTLTVTRAQEGTSAAAHNAGAAVSLNVTAKIIDDITTALDDHDARHKWGGADQLSIRDLFLAIPMLFVVEFDTGMTATTSGAGAGTVQEKSRGRVTTGAVANNYAGLVFTGGLWHHYTSSFWRWTTQTRVNANAQGITQLDGWAGWFADNSTYPTATSNHYGLHFIETAGGDITIAASNADGSTETATNIKTDWDGSTIDFLIMYGSANIKYYYSTDGGETWTLGATHTTNMPSNLDLYHGIWWKTLDANSKRAYAYGSKYIASAD
jgi:hypothetical protein